MFTGFKFMPAETLLEVSNIEMFKFYTVDSNILIGIISLIFAIYEIRIMRGKIKEMPTYMYNLKLVGTSGILLTFIVTACFLAPMYGFYAMYNNNNLFFHLIVPILSIVTYVCFENYDNKYKYAFIGMIPMVLYSIFYTINVLTHLENGKPTYTYDFYGFLQGNINNVFIVIPVMFIVSYLISVLIIFLNKKILNK